MYALTDLQRHILANLEEAGEDDISALTNTVKKRSGSPEEIDEMGLALVGLIHCGFVGISRDRDAASRRWSPLAKDVAIGLIVELRSFFSWSEASHLWTWRKDSPRVQVILTDSGLARARKILSEDGW